MPAVPVSALRRGLGCAVLIAALAACAGIQRTPTPEDVAAKRFDTLPDQAVVYLFRPRQDFVRDGASVMLDGDMLATTYPATYFRLALAPGKYRLAGFAGDSGVFDLDVQTGRLYFVEHTVVRFFRMDRSSFRVADPRYGRQAVLHSELLFSR